MHVHCDKNPAHAEGVIRHPAVLLLAAAGIVSTLIYFTINSSTGGSWQSQQQHDTRLRELMGWWDAPGLAKPRFKGAIADHMDFQHYYVAPSTVPGAGLGVFARHDMPPGFVWNVEDVQPGATLNITRSHWDSLLRLAGSLEAMGVQHHAIYDLVSFIRRYTYYCAGTDLLLVPLVGNVFTNHAFPPAAPAGAGTSHGPQLTSQGPPPRMPPRRHLAGTVKLPAQQTNIKESGRVPNSALAWSQSAEESADQARVRGVAPPNIVERCVLVRTLRAVKAGEELLEDYGSYESPWPGYRSPTTEIELPVSGNQ